MGIFAVMPARIETVAQGDSVKRDSRFDIKLTKAERNMIVRKRLFDAAVKVVGELGYAEASIARITQLAGISQGAFYKHFASRQELLDELLPTVGLEMLEYIAEETRRPDTAADKEMARFRSFFRFLKDVPEFLRILNEAEMLAPAAYRKHMTNVAASYTRIVIRARERGELADYSDDEIQVLVHVLMGARSYLSGVYAYCYTNQVQDLPDYVHSAYEKLIRNGMFKTPVDVA